MKKVFISSMVLKNRKWQKFDYISGISEGTHWDDSVLRMFELNGKKSFSVLDRDLLAESMTVCSLLL